MEFEKKQYAPLKVTEYKGREITTHDHENRVIEPLIEYCPNGHQNNLRLSNRKEGVCPVAECQYGAST